MKQVVVFAAAIVCFFHFVAKAHAGEIVVCGYNLENYSLEKGLSTAPKTERAIAVLVGIIREINPDVLGVCEMGAPQDFEDFKTRLQAAGLGYTDFEYVEAADTERHLALLSRLPIVARQSATDLAFEVNGRHEKVKRGFLDVTINVTQNQSLRLVGAHLKSKREVAEGDAFVRRSEAHLLRQHLDEIVAQNDAKLLVYGDFNALKNEPALEEIVAPRSSPRHLSDLGLADAAGDRWTQFWKAADLYSRIDYMFVNRALLSDVVAPKCRLYRPANWNEASDHLPTIATIHTDK